MSDTPLLPVPNDSRHNLHVFQAKPVPGCFVEGTLQGRPKRQTCCGVSPTTLSQLLALRRVGGTSSGRPPRAAPRSPWSRAPSPQMDVTRNKRREPGYQTKRVPLQIVEVFFGWFPCQSPADEHGAADLRVFGWLAQTVFWDLF